jgi:hypothetical protein
LAMGCLSPREMYHRLEQQLAPNKAEGDKGVCGTHVLVVRHRREATSFRAWGVCMSYLLLQTLVTCAYT